MNCDESVILAAATESPSSARVLRTRLTAVRSHSTVSSLIAKPKKFRFEQKWPVNFVGGVCRSRCWLGKGVSLLMFVLAVGLGQCRGQWLEESSIGDRLFNLGTTDDGWIEAGQVFDRRHELAPSVALGFESRAAENSIDTEFDFFDHTRLEAQSELQRNLPLYDVEVPEMFDSSAQTRWFESPAKDRTPIHWKIVDDHVNFYSSESLVDLGLVTIVAATIANTQFDQECRDIALDNLTNTGNGGVARFLHQTKGIGNGVKTLPIFAVAAATSLVSDQVPLLEPVGTWGNQSLRTFLVGAPVVAVGQIAIGGSRPGEMEYQSAWHPLADNNGISGHAFMGAIPFLAAADATENEGLKALFIVGSTLPGLSRIADDDHYTSQVVLGWTVAYLAHRAVSKTDRTAEGWHLSSWQEVDAQGLGLQKRW